MKPNMIQIDNLQVEYEEKLTKLMNLELKLDQIKINAQKNRETFRQSLNNQSEYLLGKVILPSLLD
jgi:hypothetical protein